LIAKRQLQGITVFGAIENFPAQQDGDLEFRKGNIINII
jgi:hypothetical protein